MSQRIWKAPNYEKLYQKRLIALQFLCNLSSCAMLNGSAFLPVFIQSFKMHHRNFIKNL